MFMKFQNNSFQNFVQHKRAELNIMQRWDAHIKRKIIKCLAINNEAKEWGGHIELVEKLMTRGRE